MQRLVYQPYVWGVVGWRAAAAEDEGGCGWVSAAAAENEGVCGWVATPGFAY